MQLTPEDLAVAAAGCRALAYRYREEAKRHTNPQLVEDALKRAEHAMHLAARFDFELIVVSSAA
jgi:hypothetical protein